MILRITRFLIDATQLPDSGTSVRLRSYIPEAACSGKEKKQINSVLPDGYLIDKKDEIIEELKNTI